MARHRFHLCRSQMIHSGRVTCTAAILSGLLSGCATAPLSETGSLHAYADLKPSDGLVTRSRLKVSRQDVLAAKTVRIVPTSFSEPAGRTPFTAEQRNLVTNAADRTLCVGLSERFQVVGTSEPADLTVHAVITHVTPTNPIAVGLTAGANVAKAVALPNVPVPIPRIPIGLGSLSLEAEATDDRGTQKAAMIWGRAATAFDQGRMADEGDAYGLAASFGADFSKMLVTGKTPFGVLPSLPAASTITASLGGAPKYPACEAFGRSPGLLGMVGDSMSLPPGWTDKGAKRDSPASPSVGSEGTVTQ